MILYAIEYYKNELLGAGGYGSVFKGKFDGMQVAVKRIESVKKRGIDSKREENALTQLDHPNIVKLYHLEEQPDFWCYAMELCSASMDKLFIGNSKKYCGPLPSKIDVLIQLSSALAYIHSKGFIHRDIKPENVLISSTLPVMMKLADFGLSRNVNERGTYTMSGIKGTECWLAPEIIAKLVDPKVEIRGTVKSDVFVAGCLFAYFLQEGEHPFGNLKDRMEVEQNILEEEPNIELPEDHFARKILLNMLEKKPAVRSTMKKVLDDILNADTVIQEKFFQLNAKLEPSTKQKRFVELWSRQKNSSMDVDEFVQLLKEIGIDWMNQEQKNKYGENAVFFLCQNYEKEDLLDVISLITSNGVDVNMKDAYGDTALLRLCRSYTKKNLLSIVEFLISLPGINVNIKDKSGDNALSLLCLNSKVENQLEIVKILIEHGGIDVKNRNIEGNNALLLACQYYQKEDLLDLVQVLVSNRNEIIYDKNNEEESALLLLCRFYEKDNLLDIVKFLVSIGMDVNNQDKKYENALLALCQNNRNGNLLEAMEFLISKQVNIRLMNHNGANALLLLCRHNNDNANLLDIIKLLTSKNRNVFNKDREGDNALLILCREYKQDGLLEIIEHLVTANIDIDLTDKDGDNALLTLCRHYDKSDLVDIIGCLISSDINIDSRDRNGDNALLILCRNSRNDKLLEIVQLLVTRGINIKSADKDGKNALDLIRRNRKNRNDIIEYLGVQLSEG